MVSEATARETCSQSSAVTQLDRDIYALEASGFALIPHFIDDAEIDTFLEQYATYQEEVDAFASGGGDLLNKTGWPIKSARAAWAVSQEVQDVIMDERLQAYARGYLKDPLLRDCQFLANMPDERNAKRGGDSKVSYHRDKYWEGEPTFSDYLWCFLLLDDMTPENGGTIVVPGTHRMREPGYYFLENDPGEVISSNDYLVYDRRYFASAIQVTARKGTLLMFDPMVIHTQSVNISPVPRRVLNVLFHRRGLPGIMNCRAIAENHARLPVRDDLLKLLSSDSDKPENYGPLS